MENELKMILDKMDEILELLRRINDKPNVIYINPPPAREYVDMKYPYGYPTITINSTESKTKTVDE